MSVRGAAVQVLKEAGKPLHATEISKLIIEAGLWKSDGKTPEATVSARLYSDIKSKGDKSLFVKVGPQTFALRGSTEIEGDTASVLAPVEKPSKPHPTNAGFSFIDCAQNGYSGENGQANCRESGRCSAVKTDPAGRFRGYRGVSRDITERRRTEDAKRRLEGQLLQSQKMEAVGCWKDLIASFNRLKPEREVIAPIAISLP